MGKLLIFTQRARADPRKVVEAIKAGAAQCWTLDTKPPRLFAGNRAPGFKASMMLKDLNIIIDSARAYGVPLPTSAVNAQLFAALIAAGQDDLDNSAVIGVIEELAGENWKLESRGWRRATISAKPNGLSPDQPC